MKGKIKVRTTSCCDVDLQGEMHLLHADVCFCEHICFHPLDLAANSCEIIPAHLFSNTFERKHTALLLLLPIQSCILYIYIYIYIYSKGYMWCPVMIHRLQNLQRHLRCAQNPKCRLQHYADNLFYPNSNSKETLHASKIAL